MAITKERPYFSNPVTNEPVYVHYDPPHIFKALRNNLINYDFLVSSVVIDNQTSLLRSSRENVNSRKILIMTYDYGQINKNNANNTS
jgi:hypothetical protein